jgi:uncharacterized protein YyaL (SSP411 family)
MLYDQSQLARVYLHAWQVTGNQFFRTITEEILDYVVRELSDPAGGFYTTQDADSEEGKFFVWTQNEILEVLGEEADAFMAAYSVTRHGNFEAPAPTGLGGKNILEFVGDMEQRPALAEARFKLFEARTRRVHPGRIAAGPPLQDRELVTGQAATHVCRSFSCPAPVTTPEALEGLLCVN